VNPRVATEKLQPLDAPLKRRCPRTVRARRQRTAEADALARRYSERARRLLRRVASLLLLVPWATFMLWAGWSTVWQSLRGLESFPETYNPGYFLVKAAVALLTLTVLVQGLIDTFRRSSGDGE
jgi:TRAP-type C4-dicarboxylate transport system permease small subunit